MCQPQALPSPGGKGACKGARTRRLSKQIPAQAELVTELFIVMACTRRHHPGDSSVTGARRQPQPSPSHSALFPPWEPEQSCSCDSQDTAFSLDIWLPKSGLAGGMPFLGSRHGAQPATEETEVRRWDEQPRPRCADIHTVCSGRDGAQTHAGSKLDIQCSSPRQTRAGGRTAWHRPGKGWRSLAPQVPFRCSQPSGAVPTVLMC